MSRISMVESIEALIEEYSMHVSTPIDLYLIGGGALMFHGSKIGTKDIDLIVDSKEEFEKFRAALIEMGYEDSLPTPGFENADIKAMMSKGDVRLDIFQKQVCRKLILSDKMKSRSKKVLSFEHINLHVCEKEDILIFKCMTDREGDIDDCINLIKQGGISWDAVLDEIHYQVCHGEDVWITYFCEGLQKIAEKRIKVPILKELNKMCDEFFDRYEREHQS